MILKWGPRMANSMVEDSHERAAEFHELAAHAHAPPGTTGKKITRRTRTFQRMGLNMPKGFRVVARSSSEIGEVNGPAIRALGRASARNPSHHETA